MALSHIGAKDKMKTKQVVPFFDIHKRPGRHKYEKWWNFYLKIYYVSKLENDTNVLFSERKTQISICINKDVVKNL